jgi:hypothetical protein
MDGWMEVKAVLRIAYSNQKQISNVFWGRMAVSTGISILFGNQK